MTLIVIKINLGTEVSEVELFIEMCWNKTMYIRNVQHKFIKNLYFDLVSFSDKNVQTL